MFCWHLKPKVHWFVPQSCGPRVATCHFVLSDLCSTKFTIETRKTQLGMVQNPVTPSRTLRFYNASNGHLNDLGFFRGWGSTWIARPVNLRRWWKAPCFGRCTHTGGLMKRVLTHSSSRKPSHRITETGPCKKQLAAIWLGLFHGVWLYQFYHLTPTTI